MKNSLRDRLGGEEEFYQEKPVNKRIEKKPEKPGRVMPEQRRTEPVPQNKGQAEEDPYERFSIDEDIFEETLMELSYKLLLCDEMESAESLSSVIAALNESRKEKKKKACERAHAIIREKGMENDNPIILADEKTGTGIVGLVASELVEEYETTAIVLTKKDGCFKGSARAHESASIIQALDMAYEKHPEYFLGYGGHKGAAGVTIKEEYLEDFRTCMQDIMGPRPERKDFMEYDLEIQVNEIPQAIQELKKYAPYGSGNKPITFLIRNFRVSPENGYFTSIGENGIKLHGNNCCAVSFSMRSRYIEDGMPSVIDIIGHLSEKRYMKYTSNQIEILDYRISAEVKKNTLMSMIEDALSGL